MKRFETAPWDSFQRHCAALPPGPVADVSTLERLLSAVWHRLPSDDPSMEGYKLLGRMKAVVWNAPVLSFRIERHREVTFGSSRANGAEDGAAESPPLPRLRDQPEVRRGRPSSAQGGRGDTGGSNEKGDLTMLIELNRFMTTEEVRGEYRIPDALAEDVLPFIPVVVVQEDGTRIHLESEVDRFLAEFVRQRRHQSSPAAEVNRPMPRLTDTEQTILEALGDKKVTGEELAPLAGFPFNSNFKNTLSSLVKRGLLVNDRPGYRKA